SEGARTFGVQINRRPSFPSRRLRAGGRTGTILLINDHFVEYAGDLKSGRILASRGVRAFDRLVDSFESADRIGHFAREFFKHILEMLEIAANKKLRLFGRDIERLIHRVDGVGDFLYVRL